MMRKIVIIFSFLAVSLFLFGFEGKVLLKEYKAKNADEEKIIAALIGYEQAYNDQDKERLLSFYSADAKLTPCGEMGSQVSKADYAEKFPGKWSLYPGYMFYNPEITTMGNMAELKLNLVSGGWTFDYQITMINENGNWMIQETFYSDPRME